MKFVYIDSIDALKKAVSQWNAAKEIGIDLECENNLHHYGVLISLIQISTTKQHWIVDVIKLKDIKPLLETLENPKIQKIFHDVGFDLRILNHQFDCRLKNVFDTKLAAMLLGKKDISLGSLLKEYFGIKKQKKLQMADWTKRPLPQKMLEYASRDTIHIIHLRNIFVNELQAKNRLEWAEEKFKALEDEEWELHKPVFTDLKGLKVMAPHELGVLKALYDQREKMAKKVNRPVHFIMNSKKMKAVAAERPSINGFRNMNGVHPVVKSRADEFYYAVKNAKDFYLPKKVFKIWTPKQKKKVNELTELRNRLADGLGIEGYLIISNDQVKEIVISGSYDCLMEWQRRLVLGK